jgi:acylphosphatase
MRAILPPVTAVIRRHLLIEGRVQGVGYRMWAASTMRDLGLAGWVRNLADRRVEVVVEGDAPAVETFERRCHAGPPSARVQHVRTTLEPVVGLRGVEIR